MRGWKLIWRVMREDLVGRNSRRKAMSIGRLMVYIAFILMTGKVDEPIINTYVQL